MLNESHDRPVSTVARDIAFSAKCVGFDSRAGQIAHSVIKARLRCNISSELWCPGAKQWSEVVHSSAAPPFVTHLGVIL